MQARMVGLALIAAAAGVGCGGSDTVGSSNLLAGTYVAIIFDVTQSGQAPIDVLAGGGSLRIKIEGSGTTSGTLSIPASVSGGPLNASMAGTASVTALTVEFTQDADTFVRDLVWSRFETALVVQDQPAGGAQYTITLIRE
jgi:hypothetical protein